MYIHPIRTPRVYILCCCLLVGTSIASAQTDHGQWTLGPSETPGKIRFSIESARDGHHSFSNSSDWSAADFDGLDLATPGKHDVHFTIPRDAGTFDAEGFARDGEAAGLYTFRPNAQYVRDMAALGFPGIEEENQMAFALHDVSLAYAREMKSLAIQGLDTRKLLPCRIFHIDAAFVRELQSVGITVAGVDKLIAFRIHHVSPEYVKELARLGYPHPDADQLIALRIHQVTPEYIEKIRSHGMQNLTLDQLIKLRIHGLE
ncbi:MAG: hypothetical protein JO091_15140 [Acidobacteriaceae bacterium]|nr:hypothetical protein [Acidobacteriaceae bacterium]